jgi:hypothetical protein
VTAATEAKTALCLEWMPGAQAAAPPDMTAQPLQHDGVFEQQLTMVEETDLQLMM